MTTPRRTLLAVVSIVGTSVLTFVLLEVIAMAIVERRVENSLAIFNGILSDHHNVLSITPDYRGQWRTPEFDVAVRTNSRGYREDFEFMDGEIGLAFMGDSFTFGHGVSVEKRYSNILAQELVQALGPAYSQLKVASFAGPNGFQPEHYEYFLDAHPDLQPRVLFVGLYLGNDLDGDLQETVIDRDTNGKITRLELPARDIYQGVIINALQYRYGWLTSLVQHSHLGKFVAMQFNASPRWRHVLKKKHAIATNVPNRLSTELGQLDQHNLRAIRSLYRIAEEIEKRGGGLQVLLIPQNFLVGEVKRPHIAPHNTDRIPEIRSYKPLIRALLRACREGGLRCHDLSVFLTREDYFTLDAHWNEHGHAKVGQYISDIVTSMISQK